MKKRNDLFLARFLLLSGLIAGISSFSYADENNNNNNEEKKEDLITTRSIVSIGLTRQNYTGEYRETTKDKFKVGNAKDDGTWETIDIDHSYGANISYAFELQFNIFRILNPYLGFEVSLGSPFTKQHDYIDDEWLGVAKKYLNDEVAEDVCKAFSLTGNIADVKLKAGNSFKVIKNVLDVNVYGMFGIGTTGYLSKHMPKTDYTEGSSEEAVPFAFGASYGYVYGIGIDLILVKHLLIGAYVEDRKMIDNIVHPKDEEDNYAIMFSQGGIKNYSNRTFGVKVGIVF